MAAEVLMRNHADAVHLHHQIVTDAAHLTTARELHHALMLTQEHLQADGRALDHLALNRYRPEEKRLLSGSLSGSVGHVKPRHLHARARILPRPLLHVLSQFLI